MMFDEIIIFKVLINTDGNVNEISLRCCSKKIFQYNTKRMFLESSLFVCFLTYVKLLIITSIRYYKENRKYAVIEANFLSIKDLI